jgi:hypothetical protein
MTGAQTGTCSVAAAVASATLIALLAAGCGSNGQSDVAIRPPPPDNTASISGVVLAPNWQFARAAGWRQWADALCLVPRANALAANVIPVQSVLRVAFSQVFPADADHGTIESPRLIMQVDTDDNGAFTIVDPAAANLDTCRLMVSTGSGDSWTRAFVLSKTTNIDAVGEATVRIVLDRLTRAPAVTLCDNFSRDALTQITGAVARAATLAFGDSVTEINDDAFTRACGNPKVKQAVDDATGRPASTGCGTSIP